MLDTIMAKFKPEQKEAISTIIGQDMTIDGNVSFKGITKIDGRIIGNVKGEHLILSESGMITGNVNTVAFICQGQVDGDVKADKLDVKAQGSITGKLEAIEIAVEFGASLSGEIKARTKDLRLIQNTAALQQDQEVQVTSSG